MTNSIDSGQTAVDLPSVTLTGKLTSCYGSHYQFKNSLHFPNFVNSFHPKIKKND